MFNNIGLPELIVIILVLIIFLGSKKINELARQAGEATQELKKIKEEYKGIGEAISEPPKPESKKKEINKFVSNEINKFDSNEINKFFLTK